VRSTTLKRTPCDTRRALQHGLSALHKAAAVGQLPCMRTLLEYRASVGLATSDGLTAMHLAAWKGQREALRLLHSHRADVNAAAADGGTPLHEAVRSGDLGCVQLLLQIGAAPATPDKVSLALLPLACTSVLSICDCSLMCEQTSCSSS
jgi:ankyrin repeat protein